jgi:uncharacterized protein
MCTYSSSSFSCIGVRRDERRPGMLIPFFFGLRTGGVPVTLKEFLGLLEALEARIAWLSAEDFYYLARLVLVKDEKLYDRFDRVFAAHFQGAEELFARLAAELPESWLRALAERVLSEEEKAKVESLGGWEKLLETLRERLEEQKERHEGGNKWIGTAGTSPFGAYGFNPEGVRIGQDKNREGRAVKVWDKREYKNLDDTVEIGTRNIKLALRRLRKFAREGAEIELDMPDTIRSTARNAGYLDIKMIPERRNKVKLLLLFDIGGSMDAHIRVCEELFSAARSEFKHLEFFYFHNCLYEKLWKDNRRRHVDTYQTQQLLHTFPPDYKIIFVGDASMSPYEIAYPGGSVEHWNEEAGQVWIQRMADTYRSMVWLNPVPERHWSYTPSIQLLQQLSSNRMFPLTLGGLDSAMKELNK